MKRITGLALFLFSFLICFGQGSTPNVGLQIPPTGSNNWYIPLNYNFNKIDQLLSGNLPLPNLAVTGNVTIGGTVTANAFTGVGGASFALTPEANAFSVPYFSGSSPSSTLSGVAFNGIPVYTTSAVPAAATFSNIIGLWSGTCTGTNVLQANGTCAASGGAVSSVTGAGTVSCSPTTGSVVCTGSGGPGGGIATLNGNGNAAQTIAGGPGASVASSGGTTIVTTPSVLPPVAAFGLWDFGDSTHANVGASEAQWGFVPMIGQDVAGRIYMDGVGGQTMPTIAAIAWGLYAPEINPSFAPLVHIEGGINDANNFGATTQSLNNFTLGAHAAIRHVSLSTNQAQVEMASNGSHTGVWTAFSALGAYSLPNVATTQSTYNPGTGLVSSTNGATLNLQVPAGTSVGLTWLASDASTGTFTVSLNGTLQTSLCSGTTTFVASGCDTANPISLNNGFGVFEQTFTGHTGSQNVFVITVTSATGSTATVSILSADAVPATMAGVPYVAVQGVLRQGGDVKSAATAAYDSAMSAVQAAEYAAGLTHTFFVNVRSTTSPGPGVNTTTDFTVPGKGCGGLHPCDPGSLHLAQTYENSAKAAGFNIYQPDSNIRSGNVFGPLVGVAQANGTYDFSLDWIVNSTGSGGGSAPWPRSPGLMFATNLYAQRATAIPNGRMAWEYNPYRGGNTLNLQTGSTGMCLGVQYVVISDPSQDTCPVYMDQTGNLTFLTSQLNAGPQTLLASTINSAGSVTLGGSGLLVKDLGGSGMYSQIYMNGANTTWSNANGSIAVTPLFGTPFQVNGPTNMNGNLLVGNMGTLTVQGASTLQGAATFSGGYVASTPSVLVNGDWFTGGTSTTTKPAFLVEPNVGLASNNWNTNGTGIAANSQFGFMGDLIHLQNANATRFKVDKDGNQYLFGALTMNSTKVTGLANGTAATDAVAFGQLASYASTASPVFTGTPTAPTPSTSDNSMKIATTAYVQAVFDSYPGYNGPYTGNITLTTATSDSVSISGVTTTSKCSFTATNSTAAGLTPTTLSGYYTVTSGTFTLNHAATTAAGATYGVMCSGI